ncbi:MAG: hypothetical protein K2R98_15745 [Gemmataceae bacterium]|nr:hypothetical protein [Gemmataceae bacterium]
MTKSLSLLDEVSVASPCSAVWEDMIGTDRVRYCQHCEKNVYNLSDMSRTEAAAFVQSREGRTCIQFYRRADGTMLTDDCPVGLRALRRAARRSWALIAGGMTTVLGVFVGAASYSSAERRGGQAFRQIEPFASVLEWLDPTLRPAPALEVTPLPPVPIQCVKGEMAMPVPATPASDFGDNSGAVKTPATAPARTPRVPLDR